MGLILGLKCKWLCKVHTTAWWEHVAPVLHLRKELVGKATWPLHSCLLGVTCAGNTQEVQPPVPQLPLADFFLT